MLEHDVWRRTPRGLTGFWGWAPVCVLCTVLAFLQTVAVGENMESAMKNLSIHESTLTVNTGTYDVAGKRVEVKQQGIFPIDPGEIRAVVNEPLKLSKNKPESWHSGTRLKGPDAWDINASGSFVKGSLVIRKSIEGPPLVEGKDYLVSPDFAMVGIGPQPDVTPDDEVYASYQYGLLRIDSIQVSKDGKPSLLKGRPHISAPEPPAVDDGSTRLLNIFIDYHAVSLKENAVFPVIETPEAAATRTTRGRVPKTLEKLKASQPVRIVCLGDSVTAGGNASSPALQYVAQLRQRILDKFPRSSIEVTNVSYGGTNSSQWLRVGPLKSYFDTHPELPADRINFDRVTELKPDLVTVEFVNDAPFDAAVLEVLYSEMLQRLRAINAEMILITPHFTAPKMMGVDSLRAPESRPYVAFLYEFAEKHRLAVADASSRWAHLWKEGIPYITLLHNTINHPDDRGHRLFAEELIKCFEE